MTHLTKKITALFLFCTAITVPSSIEANTTPKKTYKDIKKIMDKYFKEKKIFQDKEKIKALKGIVREVAKESTTDGEIIEKNLKRGLNPFQYYGAKLKDFAEDIITCKSYKELKTNYNGQKNGWVWGGTYGNLAYEKCLIYFKEVLDFSKETKKYKEKIQQPASRDINSEEEKKTNKTDNLIRLVQVDDSDILLTNDSSKQKTNNTVSVTNLNEPRDSSNINAKKKSTQQKPTNKTSSNKKTKTKQNTKKPKTLLQDIQSKLTSANGKRLGGLSILALIAIALIANKRNSRDPREKKKNKSNKKNEKNESNKKKKSNESNKKKKSNKSNK